jgi:glutaminase
VNVSVTVGTGVSRRISTIDPGNLFGELALFGQGRRTADVIAATDGRAMELSADAIAMLGSSDNSGVYPALALAVGKSLADRLGRATRQIQALSR